MAYENKMDEQAQEIFSTPWKRKHDYGYSYMQAEDLHNRIDI